MKRKRSILFALLLACLLGCPVVENGPGPAPEPEPSPIQVDSLKVLIIEESGDRHKLTRGQLNVLSSTKLRSQVKDRGGELLVVDKDSDLSRTEHWLRQAMELDREGLPWCIVAGPKGAWMGPLPEQIEEVIGYMEEFK